MPSFRRIHCHFCGTRSPHNKSSGIPSFQCASCESVNYLDSKGDITDPPFSVVELASRSNGPREASPAFQTFTQPAPETLAHQHSQAFCSTCQLNQRKYLDALGNYLPDEDHPKYREYEDALPQFKKQLESRYPQVCKRCAPLAQRKIHRADYYAGTQNIGRRANRRGSQGASTRRQRDDWSKWSMRRMLGLAGLMVHASLVLQICWHIYGIMVALHMRAGEAEVELDFEPKPSDCVRESLAMQFNTTCLRAIGAYVPRGLLVSLCLIWYNPGLWHWYHHSTRIESISGQTEHFRMQAVLLVIRAVAFYKLSNAGAATSITTPQLLASHAFAILSICLITWVSRRGIKPVKFRLKQKMMPLPEQADILGATAGPETATYQAQASSIPPSQLFARDRIAPFPISNLAPKATTRNTTTGIPSPATSDSDIEDDEGDPMEVDEGPTMVLRSQAVPGAPGDQAYRPNFASTASHLKPMTRSRRNHGSSTTGQGGWSNLRGELFGMEDIMHAETLRKQQEAEQKAKLRFQQHPTTQSPFRGRLPPAPMSMERKLRNPVTQLAFKETPASKKQDFMRQMREGIEAGSMFGATPRNRQVVNSTAMDDDDEEFSPVKSRTRGGLELRPSQWQLKADVETATGLEDLFGGTGFRIAEEVDLGSLTAAKAKKGDRKRNVGLIVAGVCGLAMASMFVPAMRRAVCLWLVDRLEKAGY